MQLLPETVTGGDADAESSESEHVVPPLAHHTFVCTPILAQAAQLAREKEANAAAISSNSSVVSGKSNRSFRRQPPFYVDSMSTRSQWTSDPRNRKGTGRVPISKPGGSPRNGMQGMNYGGGGGGSGQSSPMHAPSYGRMPAPMMVGQPAMVSGSYPVPLVMQMPMQIPMGSPLQQGVPMPVYSQQMQQMQMHYMQQQQQIYQNYQAQMHPSMANSLSSSYGAAQSPMSHSPMAMYQQQSYMATVVGAAQQQQQQPQQHLQQGAPEPQSSPKNLAAQGQQQHW